MATRFDRERAKRPNIETQRFKKSRICALHAARAHELAQAVGDPDLLKEANWLIAAVLLLGLAGLAIVDIQQVRRKPSRS